LGVNIEAVGDADEMLRALRLDHPDGWESFEQGELINRTGRGFVRRFRWPARDGDLFYFKLYRLSRRSKRLLSIFRKDWACREAANLAWLRANAIPAVEPVAWGVSRSFRVVRCAFIVTRAETSLEGISKFVPVDRERRPWIGSLGRFVRRMHDAGFFAHDLHFRNVLGGPDGANGSRFVLLDLPHGYHLSPGDPRRMAAVAYDLASLDRHGAIHLSRTDRFRFLNAYLGPGCRDRDLIAAIERRTLLQAAKRESKLARRFEAERARDGREERLRVPRPG
jgi:hypothetical protein